MNSLNQRKEKKNGWLYGYSIYRVGRIDKVPLWLVIELTREEEQESRKSVRMKGKALPKTVRLFAYEYINTR